MAAEPAVHHDLLSTIGLGKLEEEYSRRQIVNISEAKGTQRGGELMRNDLDLIKQRWGRGRKAQFTFTSSDENRCFILPCTSVWNIESREAIKRVIWKREL